MLFKSTQFNGAIAKLMPMMFVLHSFIRLDKAKGPIQVNESSHEINTIEMHLMGF